MVLDVPPLQGRRGLLGDVYLGLRAARFTPGFHMTGFQPCYSALEWVIDQYQVNTDKRSGITNDPDCGSTPHPNPRPQ